MGRTTRSFGLLMLILGVAVEGTVVAWATTDRRTTVTLDQAPSAVQASLKKLVDTQGSLRLTRDVESEKTTYLAEYRVGTVKHAAKLNEAGVVLLTEKEIKATELPTPVTDAIKAKYPGGKIEDCVLARAGTGFWYRVDVEVGKADHILTLAASGVIQDDKLEEDDDDGPDDDDLDEFDDD